MTNILYLTLSVIFICALRGISPTAAKNPERTQYANGLIRFYSNESEEPIPICMVYPVDLYSLSTISEKKFHLSYDEKLLDLCQKNLTTDDFIPTRSSSLLLVSASTNCSISHYFELMRDGNASGIIILSNSTYHLNESYGWEVFGVVGKSGISMFLNSTRPGEGYGVELFGYRQFDVSLIILWVIAVFCVAVGSFTGPYRLYGAEREHDRETLDNQDETKDHANEAKVYDGITVPVAIGLVVFISTTLLLLYFFYQYLVYFFIFVFCLASPRALYLLILQLINYIAPDVSFPKIWKFGIHEIFFATACLALSIVWFIFRHESWVWGIQDLLGMSFCIHLIQTLHLPNLKIITSILVLLFIYDVFFVFITPYFTSNGKSVMVEVATGVSGSGSKEQLPMLLLIPRILANPASQCGGREVSLLGYGDIIVPGFLVCFAHGFDLQCSSYRKCRPYFIVSLIAYTLGLAGAFVALLLSSSGQPALFYIVPSILIAIFIVGLIRKEVKSLWRGKPDVVPALEQDSA